MPINSNNKITHSVLVERAARWLKNQNCGVVFDDRFCPATPNGEQPDAMGFRSSVSIMIECKSSRSDFLSDKRKRFRANPILGMGDWRFYMCPPDIIKVKDLPEGWGLLYFDGRVVKKIHGVPPNTQWFSKKPFQGQRDAELSMMYSALRRLCIRGSFEQIYDPL